MAPIPDGFEEILCTSVKFLRDEDKKGRGSERAHSYKLVRGAGERLISAVAMTSTTKRTRPLLSCLSGNDLNRILK
jgi:hypothetical protein